MLHSNWFSFDGEVAAATELVISIKLNVRPRNRSLKASVSAEFWDNQAEPGLGCTNLIGKRILRLK